MTDPQAILIVCNRVPYPLTDGGALAMYAMIEGWHRAGRHVHVLAMNTSKHRTTEAQLPSLFREISGFGMVDVDTDIRLLPVLRNLVASDKPEHADRFYHKTFENRLVALLNIIRPGLIQFESIYLHEYVSAVRKHSSARIIQRLHNVEGEVWQRLANGAQNYWKRGYLRLLARRVTQYEQRVWRESDGLITISNKDLLAVKNSGCRTPAYNIPYGTKLTSEFSNPGIPGTWTAYHIGAMDWKPNCEAMEWMRTAIVPEIVARLPDFAFHFAGRKMPEEFLSERQISFFCHGEVADAQAFLSDKQVLIVPLRSGSGIRVKTLEAMTAGKLVISTTVGIQGIEALDKIHFLRADTPQEFAEAVCWVMQHKELAVKIIHNARDLVDNNHNQDRLMAALNEFVEKLS
jgi:glycosyltransferase involved in cell wall biosynthesis